jgi:hypothetical protein
MVTGLTETGLGVGSVMFRWDLGAPGTLFYLYSNGVLIEVTTRNWKQLDLAPGETVVFTVSDDVGELIPIGAPNRGILNWGEAGDAVTAKYEIEELEGEVWVARGTIWDLGESWFRWISRVLEDGVEHRFRVTACDVDGLPGQAREVAMLMVRAPDPLELTLSWEAELGRVKIEW